jgi:hypothetical protein
MNQLEIMIFLRIDNLPVDYKESISKLNDLLKNSDGEPIDIDLLIETLIDKNIDNEMKILVKLALDSFEEIVNLKDMVEGIINLFEWRENNC